jgi:hypothetical protein
MEWSVQSARVAKKIKARSTTERAAATTGLQLQLVTYTNFRLLLGYRQLSKTVKLQEKEISRNGNRLRIDRPLKAAHSLFLGKFRPPQGPETPSWRSAEDQLGLEETA